MPDLDLSHFLYPDECPDALRRWGNSLIGQRVGNKKVRDRVAGWRWDGVSQEIVLVLAPNGMKMQFIGPNTWAATQMPLGTLVVQDVYGEATFKVVGHRRGMACLRSDHDTYHYADIRHLTKVGMAVKESEGNEDSAEGMPGGRSAAGSVRPDPHSAATGLGEEALVAAASPSPRIQPKEETCS